MSSTDFWNGTIYERLKESKVAKLWKSTFSWCFGQPILIYCIEYWWIAKVFSSKFDVRKNLRKWADFAVWEMTMLNFRKGKTRRSDIVLHTSHRSNRFNNTMTIQNDKFAQASAFVLTTLFNTSFNRYLE